MSANREVIVSDEDFSDMPPLESYDPTEEDLALNDEEDYQGVISQIAGLIAANRITSSGSTIIHRDCGVCQQFESAVFNYVGDRGDNPHTALHEESRGLLEITQEIWLEHLVEIYQNFVRERQRIRDIVERSMDESKPPHVTATNDEIESLETKPYENGMVDSDKNSCAICLTEFEEGDIVTNTACSHFFHRNCLDKWLIVNVKCPVCRSHAITGEIIDD